MTALSWALLALAAAGLAFGLWQWVSRRRTLRRLNAMLDRAIAGGFAEDRFDETELSALEGKLARFLRGSAAAKKAVEGEQAAVKSLIADISHQTRTPVANLLLYASLLGEGELSPAQREQVQALTAQGEKLSFLIQALVKASRLEAGIVAPVPACNPVGPLLEGAAEQLAEGNIDADPYWHNADMNACRYCDYAAACHFEECCGDRVRRRKALTAGEFWQLLRKKEGENDGL